MSVPHPLLADLQSRGVQVVAEGQQLRCRGPRGALRPADLDRLKAHKTEILAELHHTEAAELTGGKIVEARHELGAVLIRSNRLDGELWVALDPGMAAELRAEEQARETPRPVLLPEDVAALRGKPEAMIRATLNVLAVFPGAQIQ